MLYYSLHAKTRDVRPVMALSLLLKFIYPPPASFEITAVSAISFLTMCHAGFKEIKGENLQHSKFFKVDKKKKVRDKVRSKLGFIVVYTPSFLAALFSLFIFPFDNPKFTLLRFAITLHFFNRLFEVLIVHKFSGWMDVEAMLLIFIGYFLSTPVFIYNQQLMQQFPQPAINLNYIGIPLFLLGIAGNFYHYYLLSKLRNNDEKEYKIPRGGLFSIVICPHYLFEIIEFWGMFCISQTIYAFLYVMGTTILLVGRSYATRKWYESKFEDSPKDVKALIPYIF